MHARTMGFEYAGWVSNVANSLFVYARFNLIKSFRFGVLTVVVLTPWIM